MYAYIKKHLLTCLFSTAASRSVGAGGEVDGGHETFDPFIPDEGSFEVPQLQGLVPWWEDPFLVTGRPGEESPFSPSPSYVVGPSA